MVVGAFLVVGVLAKGDSMMAFRKRPSPVYPSLGGLPGVSAELMG
ncbi:hypothetical protein ABDB91_03590 [Desulfoscipio sp. XC116]